MGQTVDRLPLPPKRPPKRIGREGNLWDGIKELFVIVGKKSSGKSYHLDRIEEHFKIIKHRTEICKGCGSTEKYTNNKCSYCGSI